MCQESDFIKYERNLSSMSIVHEVIIRPQDASEINTAETLVKFGTVYAREPGFVERYALDKSRKVGLWTVLASGRPGLPLSTALASGRPSPCASNWRRFRTRSRSPCWGFTPCALALGVQPWIPYTSVAIRDRVGYTSHALVVRAVLSHPFPSRTRQ